MADEPNKPVNSSNKPINGEDKLARIQARRSNELPEYTVKQQELEDRIRVEEARFAERQAEYSSITDPAERLKSYSRLEAQAARVTQSEERLSTFEDRHAQKVNASAANEISTHTKYDNVNARTTTMAGRQKYFAQIQQDRGLLEVPTEVLEERIQGRQERIATLGVQLAGQTRGLSYGDFTPEMKAKANQIGDLEEAVALDKRLQKVQNKRGMTTEKRQYSTEDLIENAERIAGRESLKQDVAGGKKYGSFEEELNKLTEMTSKVREAEKAWVDSLKNATDENGELTEEYKNMSKGLQEAKKDLAEQTDAVMEIKRQGGGGGNRFNNARDVLGVAGLAARTASTIGLDYELEQTGQRAAFANMANSQYQNVDKLLGGDMGSLLQLTKGDAFQKMYSDKLRNRAMGFKGAEAGAQILDAGVSSAAAIGEGALFDAGGLKAQAVSAAGSASQAALMSTRLGYGIEQGGYAARAQQMGLGLSQAINAIPANTLQEYYNINQQGYQGGIGMGSGARNSFMSAFTDVGNMKSFAGAGMTPQQAMQTATMGAGQFGTSEDLASFALRAGRAQQRGTMGRENYVQATGMLAGVGGGSADLESIMSKAVTVGMENAKNINQMVSATAALAGGSAAGGFGVGSATEDMISSSIQALRSMGVDKNIASGAAANALAGFDTAVGKKGTLADLQFRAQAQSIYGNTSLDESMSFAQMRESEMKQILQGGDNAYNIAAGMGIAGTIGIGKGGSFENDDARAKFQQLLTAKQKKGILDTLGTRGWSDPTMVDQIQRVRAGGSIDDASVQAKQAWYSATGQQLASATASGALSSEYANASAENKAFQSMETLNGERSTEKFEYGKGKLDEFGGLAGLVDVMKEAMAQGGPEKMEAAVSKAAKNLEAPSQLFSTGANTFDGAVNKFVAHLKSLGVAVDTPAKAKSSNLDKVQESGNGSTKKGGGNTYPGQYWPTPKGYQ